MSSHLPNGVPLFKLIRELGYSSCLSTSVLRNIFIQVGITATNADTTLSESEVAQVLGMMAQTHTGLDEGAALSALASVAWSGATGLGLGDRRASAWDVEVFVSVVMEMRPKTDWNLVIRNLDYDDFYLFDFRGFEILLLAIRAARKDLKLFPVASLWGRWNNTKAQLSILKYAVLSPPEIFNFAFMETRKIFTIDTGSPTNSTSNATNTALKQMQTAIAVSTWNSLDLMETLTMLADSEFADAAKELFDLALKQAPELVLLGLAQIDPPWNTFHSDLANSLLLRFLASHPSASLVIPKIWAINTSWVLSGLVELYRKDQGVLSRILDVSQEVKGLPSILETKPFSFTIDLAALASRRDFLNLEKWLMDHVREHGEPFWRACLEFLVDKAAMHISRQEQRPGQGFLISGDTVSVFLKVMCSVLASMNTDNLDLLKKVTSTWLQYFPQLSTVSAPILVDGAGVPPEVEEEANSYYERMYTGDLTIEQMIELLLRFKSSTVEREQQVYSCMILNLFDEYRFFSGYPDNELAITGTLFGSLVQHQVVTYNKLGIALRCVLDALRQPSNTQLFKFGARALAQFTSRLSEWPQFCSHLLSISHLQDALPELYQIVLTASQQSTTSIAEEEAETSLPEVRAGEGVSDRTSNSLPNQPILTQQEDRGLLSTTASSLEPNIVFRALRLDALLDGAEDDNFEVPPEAVQDKIEFNVNNVAPDNLVDKVSKIKEALKPPYFRWFANYLVVKRASQEPNQHSLYMSMLDAIGDKELARDILTETFAKTKRLLESEKTMTSSGDRTLLKNLGSWLGGITLAKNLPIKHKYLSLKDLLIEGYDLQRLIVVIPFVCKVLEQCSQSKVFKPPNPWLIAIMRLLAELYHFADLKLPQKFEIEVLCKKLSIDIKVDIEPSTLLKDRQPKGSEGPITTRDSDQFPLTVAGASQAQSGQISSIVGIGDEPQPSGLPTLAQFITFNPNVPIFSTQPALKRIVAIAFDRAIREIIGPVVERAVTIATTSARELVLKDFATEPSEERLRRAAHQMVQSLAGSLASVTCKEPLRLSMVSHLRTFLLQNGYTEQTLPEQAIFMMVADNLDTAVSIIEKTAAEKAAPEIDDALGPAYYSRRIHRERSVQPFYDVSVFAGSRYPTTLPDALRLKPGGLSSQQLRVYEDFHRISQSMEKVMRSTAPARQDPSTFFPQASTTLGQNPSQLSQPQEELPQVLTLSQALERGQIIMAEIEKIIGTLPPTEFANLSPDNELSQLMKQLQALVSRCGNRDEAAFRLSSKAVYFLYRNETSLSRAVYLALLERFCEISKKVGKEVTQWMLYADDDRKYNVPLYYAILQIGIFTVAELDMQLARLMESGRLPVVDFAARLIKHAVVDDAASAVATINDFQNSLDVLNRITQRGKAPESVLILIEELRKRNPMFSGRDLSKDVDKVRLREQLQFLFLEWVRIYNHPASNEQAQAAYITQLQQYGVLKGEDVSSLFFRVCTEVSVDNYIKYRASAVLPQHLAFQAVDAFARLIVLFVKYHALDGSNLSVNVLKIQLTTKILSIVVLVLVHAHEQKRGSFDQRPFFRLFSSLLHDLDMYQEPLQPIYFQILSAMSNTFHTLQPAFLPGFTFSWLQLIAHRLFMPKLLNAESQKGWVFFQRLLTDLFKFMGPYLRPESEMKDAVRTIYRGTLRIMLLLLHDFPEFLSGYHFSLTDVIPPSCIQLRNLILSAFPRNMRLPDPFTPNLKVDLLPEIGQPPVIMSDYTTALATNNVRGDVDAFIQNRGTPSFLADLPKRLMSNDNSSPSKYNIPLVNALVLYVGIQAIAQLPVAKMSGNFSAAMSRGAHIDIFQYLMTELDTEGRYYFLSAIANQLRFPNSQTQYFSCVLLLLFAEATQEIVQEQITRVLLERLIVNRPHPWGLLITFIELIKNARYNFWRKLDLKSRSPLNI
ncbi:Not1-domain-containing protein [Gonapodya prolifera JEL478]|uniref:General negative regulator of transcription subunit 1 n=1 Tax=Gonapodya prolifera (strain JEL478) TaxID=1344416 RepID=A0A139AEU2_GONPJ|nr:Not1-domain-containing protein [Gonapodya prolifera JEL478]|eukprot:KXS15104.1 Not1-domain-containing protein [Gonapodya prolifera JEL478]